MLSILCVNISIQQHIFSSVIEQYSLSLSTNSLLLILEKFNFFSRTMKRLVQLNRMKTRNHYKSYHYPLKMMKNSNLNHYQLKQVLKNQMNGQILILKRMIMTMIISAKQTHIMRLTVVMKIMNKFRLICQMTLP